MSEPHPPRRVLRRIGAVLAGLLAVIILSAATDPLLRVGSQPGPRAVLVSM